ncbi:MAG: sulfur carrier protein ThiS [Pyrinomonadaceae bacterium]
MISDLKFVIRRAKAENQAVANINIRLNGEVRGIDADIDLIRLLEVLSLPSQRIAVELNGTVIRRADWPATLIREGDRIEVVHFVGGG